MTDFQQDGMEEVLADFIMEAEELLGPLDENFIELEKSPDNIELVNEIFRSVHTIKGASGFLGLDQMVEISHKAEDVLNKIRQGQLDLTPEIMDILLRSIDIIKELIDKIKNKDEKEADLSEVLKELGNILGDSSEATDRKETKAKQGEADVDKKVENNGKIEKGGESENRPAQDKNEIKKAKAIEKAPQASKGEKTLRVDINRLDNLMNLVGELVLDRNRLTSINSRLEGKFEDDMDIKAIGDLAGHLNRVTSDLQLAVMKTRMQPIKKVFSKFPRMVRDLAREIKKDINLEIIGEETELDKSIIEEIGDPLVHLIRNSVDHGIETREERKKSGKAAMGKIRLAAFHEGNNIVIEIEDDGKGMDTERIKKKAIEKGILDKVDAERLSQKECLNLIFAPGFSTAEKISDISGRGVGMDVVKTNITKLNGIINIESVVGKGTIISIKLPLTIAIIHALMVQVGKDIFAIPLVSVIEIIKILKKNIHIIEGQEVINVRDSVLPLIRLEREFCISKEERDEDCLYVVVIGIAEKRFGIVVDYFLGQEEIVIKSMGEFLKDSQEIAGATITGDGKVILILDIAKLVQANRLQNTLI
jgi:two-component system chemotaxis sensor kinase CheA